MDRSDLTGPRGLTEEVLREEEDDSPAPAGSPAFYWSMLTPERKARIQSVVDARLQSVTVVLDRLLDPHNTAAVLRTAEGLGLARAHVVPHDASDAIAHRRVTQDAHKWLEIDSHPSGAQAAQELRARGYEVWAGHLAPGARLYTEVREKRGLAYGVSSSLVPLAHAQLISGSTATRADRTADTLEIIEREMKNLAENGPTDQELAKTKSFLKGSYGLYFDTSSKIAAQLVQIQLDKLGIDYIDRRNAMIDAVTRADAQRLAKRLLDGKMLITVVGKPQGVTSKDVSAAGSGG